MPDAKDNTKRTGDTHPPEVREAANHPPGRSSPPEAAQAPESQGGQGAGAPQGKRPGDVGTGKDEDGAGAGKS